MGIFEILFLDLVLFSVYRCFFFIVGAYAWTIIRFWSLHFSIAVIKYPKIVANFNKLSQKNLIGVLKMVCLYIAYTPKSVYTPKHFYLGRAQNPKFDVCKP
jgi:predicted cation transporter